MSERGQVEVVYALPERQRVVALELRAGESLTAGEAVERAGLLREFPDLALGPLVLGIFGRLCDSTRVLRDGDRVEIYRPLHHDPRVQRRERVAAVARRGRRR